MRREDRPARRTTSRPPRYFFTQRRQALVGKPSFSSRPSRRQARGPTGGPLPPRHSPDPRDRDSPVARGPNPGVQCARADLSGLRSREPAGSLVLHGLRRAARRDGNGAGGAQDGDRAVLRPRGLNDLGRDARPRGPPSAARAVLRCDAGGNRAPRRPGREVHRGCRVGSVRASDRPRGRRPPGGPGGDGDAGPAGRAQRRIIAPARLPNRSHDR